MIGVAVLGFAAGIYFAINYGSAPKLEGGVANAVETTDSPTEGRADATPPPDSIELSENQLKFVKVAAVEERDFPIEKGSVGSIDFNEELLTQVFTPYQGKDHRAVRQGRRRGAARASSCSPSTARTCCRPARP